jgi:hypothetical protein
MQERPVSEGKDPMIAMLCPVSLTELKPCMQERPVSDGKDPMIAMLCPVRGEKRSRIFQNKFLTSEGKIPP